MFTMISLIPVGAPIISLMPVNVVLMYDIWLITCEDEPEDWPPYTPLGHSTRWDI